jgi:uncharacterized repeat protein (TIGR04076 family)
VSDNFNLYDLEVFVVGEPKTFVCGHRPGLAFRVVGENLVFDKNGQFSLYALAALLPFFPAKQRVTHGNDWMTSDELIACPDPHCGAKFRISRTTESTYDHAQATKVLLKN